MKISIIILAVAIVAGALIISGGKTQLGGYSVSTITNTSSSIGMIDTLAYSPSNLQFLRVTNIGTGKIFCGFSTTSTLAAASSAVNNGLVINPMGSSTLVSFETVDSNFLSKYMHCVADTTSTVSILKY